MRKVSSKIIN
jgi:hypothetical protein